MTARSALFFGGLDPSDLDGLGRVAADVAALGRPGDAFGPDGDGAP